MLALANDESRNAFVFNVDQNFKFEDVYQKIIDYATNTVRLIRVTEHNIDKVFNVFQKVVKDKKVTANEIVAYFIGAITNKDEYYLHPTKKNTFCVPGGKMIRVDSDMMKAFMTHFASSYSPKEKARIAAISDRLIEDVNRRRKGEFYTPTQFADYSMHMLEDVFGENVRDEYVFIDVCCGTKNLERDWKFKELYLSTLEQSELDISSQYCQDAKATFTFDFLNDSDEELFRKAPGIKEAFEQNKKIIFYLNPPYSWNTGTMNAAGAREKISLIGNLMKEGGCGKCSQNLYAQFLFRIIDLKKKYNLTNCNLALFCKPNYLSTAAYKNFRKIFFKYFSFSSGILFNAGHFGDVSSAWGINFAIFSKPIDNQNNLEFNHTLLDIKDGEIDIIGTKTLYNLDNSKSLMEHGKIKEDKKDKCDFPLFISAIRQKLTGKNMRGENTFNKNAFGQFLLGANNVYQNAGFVSLFSGAFSQGGRNILKENAIDCMSIFSARKLTIASWINDKDEYIYPDITNINYNNFAINSIIYSLFNDSCNFSSLRQVDYHNKKWDIKNHFFWMSNQEMKDLADQTGLDEVYTDANGDQDRFVYSKLQTVKLSPEAQAVYDKACELTRASMKYRALFDTEHPEYQLTKTWDSGWY